MRRRITLWNAISAAFVTIVFVATFVALERMSVRKQTERLYLGSVQQVAQSISTALKVFDVASIHRLIANAIPIAKDDAVIILDANEQIVYSKPTVARMTDFSCKETVIQSPIVYNGQEIGKAIFCLKTEAKLQPRYIFSIIGLAVLFGIVFFVMLDRVFTTAIREVMKFCAFVERMSPEDDASCRMPPDSMNGDGRVRLLYRKVEDLVERMKAARETATRMERQAAIAQTTQMLAHDVRKPFTQLQLGLSLLRQIRENDNREKIIDLIEKNVTKSLASVNAMIEDVMEIGRTSDLRKEPASLFTIIEASVSEISQIFDRGDIQVECSLFHRHKICVDSRKILRVFSNVLANALQAMRDEGTVLLQSWDEPGSGFVHVVVANTGPVIPPEVQPRLFDAFFTSKKKGGTGLGLAIVQRIVCDHGGSVRVLSPGTAAAVEFHFTFPSSDQPDGSQQTSMPRDFSSRSLRDSCGSQALCDATEHSARGFTFDEGELVSQIHSLGRPVSVVLLDDETIYHDALRGHIEEHNQLRKVISFLAIQDPSAFIQLVLTTKPDCCICDIDLGMVEKDGLDVVESIREKGFSGYVCIHSNRALAQDVLRAKKTQVDAFHPKPMSKEALLSILTNCVQGIPKTHPTNETTVE